VRDQLQRRVVGPLEVVEQDDQRRAAGELLEQRAHRAVRAVALVLQRGRRRRARGRDGREHARELGHAVAEHALHPVGSEPVDVVVERVDPDAERQVALELSAAAGEHDAALLLGAAGELLEQAGLADPGLAAQRDEAGAPADSLECRHDRGELAAAADELPARGHGPTVTARRGRCRIFSRARGRAGRRPRGRAPGGS
jgi:hypothetical protein